jgi:TRAP-type C4-dicarboxylate transport system permease small subunit
MMDGRGRQAWLRRIVAVGVLVSSAAVALLMVIGAADVVGTAFGYPVPGAVELMEVLMVLVIFLALPEVELNQRHITVDLVVRRLPRRARRLSAILACALGLAFFTAMAWEGWELFWDSWKVREYASGLLAFPIYPVKALFAVSVTVVSAIALVNLALAIFERDPGRAPAQPGGPPSRGRRR